MVKLIALDLDGTLLNSQKEISSENKQAIKEAKEKGIHVVVCTGRPIQGVRHILEELNLVSDDDYVVTFNGGLVQTAKSEKTLATMGHTTQDVQEMYQLFWHAGLPFNPIDVDFVYETTYPDNNPSLYKAIADKKIAFAEKEVTDFEAEHVFNKAVSCCPVDILDERMALLPAKLFETYNIMKSRPILLEILPKAVDKAYGLKEICRLLNISSDDVMAIGDEENDLAMITFAGYGVAMGNATPHVKEVAKFVTGTHDESGVAQAIRHYAL